MAVAHAHDEPTVICEAVDTDWWGWKDALEEVGIAVYFPCENHIREKWQEKQSDDR